MFDRKVLQRAADAAMDYRTKVASEERSTVAPYREVLDAFAGALPETPAEASEVIDALIENASPGLRAMSRDSHSLW